MRLRILVLILAMLALSLPAEAQCAMCGAVAESSGKTGSTVATGLNSGILYLMAFPYLIMGAIAYAIYRQKKASKEAESA